MENKKYLLFSDYDNTYKINRSPILISYNNDKIKNFMSNGHLFGITTKRSYEEISAELKKYGILYDFLSFYCGRVTIDSKGNVLFINYIDDFTIEEILKLLAPYKNEIIVELNDESDKLSNASSTVCLNIAFNNPLMLFKIKELLKSTEGIELFSSLSNPFFINILSDKTNKKDAVEFIAKKENVDDKNIFVCGDSIEDLEMIKKFNGFSSFLGHPTCMINSLGIIFSVGSLAENIEKGFARVRKP